MSHSKKKNHFSWDFITIGISSLHKNLIYKYLKILYQNLFLELMNFHSVSSTECQGSSATHASIFQLRKNIIFKIYPEVGTKEKIKIKYQPICYVLIRDEAIVSTINFIHKNDIIDVVLLLRLSLSTEIPVCFIYLLLCTIAISINFEKKERN